MTIKEAYQSLKKGLDSKIEDKLKKLQALTSEDGIKTYGSYASELSTLDGKYPGTGGIRTFITGRDKLTYDFIDLDKYYISDEVDAMLAEEKKEREEADDALNQRMDDLEEQLDNEILERKDADETLLDNIDKETERAEAAEQVLLDNIDKETERAEAAEADLDQKIINEHNLSVEADENLGKDISQVRSDLSAESDSREEADKKLEELVTEVQGKIIDEHNLSVEADDALRVLIEALQDKLIYFDDHFVCKSNDSEGYLNWDKDAGIYFNDANVGDMWKLVAGEDSVPLCFAVTVDGITYQYCIDMKTGNAYYRYSDVGEGSLADIPWIPVVNTDTNLFIFTDSLPTEDIEENKIYCIPDPDSDETNNLFDEYYYHDGKWELFGKYTLKVSLDDYYTKEETYSKEEVLANFQQKLTAGTGITIEDNVISATVTGGITSVLASGTAPLTLDASTTDGVVHITGSVDTSDFATTSDLAGKQDALKWYTETANSASIGANAVYIDAGTGGVLLTCPESHPFTYNDCEVATQCWVEDNYYTQTEIDNKLAVIEGGGSVAPCTWIGYGSETLSGVEGGTGTISRNLLYPTSGTPQEGDAILYFHSYHDDPEVVFFATVKSVSDNVITYSFLYYFEISGGSTDLSNYYTKSEINNLIDDLSDTYYTKQDTDFYFQKKLNHYTEDTFYGDLSVGAKISGKDDSMTDEDTFVLVGLTNNVASGYDDHYWNTEVFHQVSENVRLKAHYEYATAEISTVQSMYVDFIHWEVNTETTNNELILDNEFLWLKGKKVATLNDLSDLKSELEAEISTATGGGIVGIDASGDDILTLTGTVDNGTAIIRGSVDLSDYAKESDLSNFVTFDFLSSTLSSGYVTESSLSTTLKDYVKSSELSNYVTSSDLSTVLADYAKTSDIPKVIDSLESDSTVNALSANMGRVLEEEISAKLDELQHYSEESSNVTITANHVNIDADKLLYNDVEVATVTDLEELKNTLEGEITTAAGGGVTVVNASGTSPLVLDATVEDGTATITGYISSGYYASQTSLDSLASSLSNCITSSTIGNYLDSYLLSSVAQETYQKKLTAGSYISITDDNVINTTYVAGPGILIGSPTTPTIALNVSTEGDSYINLDLTDSDGTQKIISASLTESFLNVINGKQDSLTAGNNISISNNVISAVLDDYITSGNLTDTLKDYVTTEQLNDAIAGVTPGEGDTEVNKVVAVNADTTGVLSFSGTPQIGEVTITASIKESGLIEFINNNIESISIEEIDNLF